MNTMKLSGNIRYAWVAVAMAAITFSTSLQAAPPPGSPGDHHPHTDQESVLHFSASLMFWEYVTFGIVVAILGFVVFPMLLKQLDKRQNRIKDALDKADQVRSEAEVLLLKHQEMMQNAQQEAKKITDEAVVAGKEAAERIKAEADKTAGEIRARAEKELGLLRAKAEEELRKQAVELALLASSRILERSLSEEDHRRLAQEAIEGASAISN
jgi:F-type H+-transporting ATPase subunit b